MAIYECYGDLTTLRTMLGKAATDTADDARLRAVLESVSRLIANYCKRSFGVWTGTKYFDGIDVAWAPHQLWIDDLLAVTALTADYDNDGTAETTITSTYYLLWPYNSWPKQRIDLNLPASPSYSYWPATQRAVTVAGVWGYGDGDSATPYADSGTTATVATAGGTTLTVVNATPFSVGHTIRVESEDMYVTAVGAGSLTVVRGVNGTTGAAHAAAATYIYQAPGPVREACLLQAARLFQRKSAIYGVVGASEMGQIVIPTKLDPDVAMLLAPYRK